MRQRLPGRVATLLGLLFLLAAGCRAIPDLSPFSEATAEIDLAANRTHDFVVTDLGTLAESAPDGPTKRALLEARDAFSKQWKVRLKATEAMAAYSASLVSIADAGLAGRESARALAGSLNDFLGAIPTVTAQIPAAVVDLAAWTKGEVDKVRAAKSLAEAVRAANPLVLDLAGILEKDFAAVEARIDATAIAAQALVNAEYGDLPAYRESLLRRQEAFATKIRAIPAGEPIPEEILNESALVARLLEETGEWFPAYRDRYAGVTERSEMERAILEKAREAVIRWAKAHGDLATALAEKRVPSATTLANKAVELKTLVERLRGGSE